MATHKIQPDTTFKDWREHLNENTDATDVALDINDDNYRRSELRYMTYRGEGFSPQLGGQSYFLADINPEATLMIVLRGEVSIIPSAVNFREVNITRDGDKFVPATGAKSVTIDMTSVSATFAPNGMKISPDGTKLIMSDRSTSPNRIYQFTMSKAWEIDSLVYDTFFELPGAFEYTKGLDITLDGTRLLTTTVENSGGAVKCIQYHLGTAWDISGTMLLDSNKLTMQNNSGVNLIQHCNWSHDGDRVLVSGDYTGWMSEFHLSTQYDLSSSGSTVNEQYLKHEWPVGGQSTISSFFYFNDFRNGMFIMRDATMVIMSYSTNYENTYGELFEGDFTKYAEVQVIEANAQGPDIQYIRASHSNMNLSIVGFTPGRRIKVVVYNAGGFTSSATGSVVVNFQSDSSEIPLGSVQQFSGKNSSIIHSCPINESVMIEFDAIYGERTNQTDTRPKEHFLITSTNSNSIP